MDRKQRKGKKSIIYTCIGIILIIISLSINIYNNYEEYDAGRKSNEVLNIMKENINTEKNNIDNNEQSSNNNHVNTINIEGYNYLGTITIPTLNLELPIMDQYDYDRLKIAPCLYYGSIYTNDLIICAHSYKTHFGYIGSLKQGDDIIISDLVGNNYIYEVLEIEILAEDDVYEMINNDFDLTLYTCTTDGFNRVTVRCNRKNKVI